MDARALGHKIKEARLSKKLTQSEVVGNFITRNMLSQIESGTAMPSMKTLAYLASVLELPLSSLLAEERETAELPRPSVSELTDASLSGQLLTLKSRAAEQDYEGILLLVSNPFPDTGDALYDEKSAYLARASYECALRCEAKNDLAGAISHAKNAEQYASEGFYANQALKADALLLLARLAEQLGRQYR
ncbi:MAG: helix-turn-helix domain-containing protein [Lachnospiraceae bacterium]|nr:helix-turn-helix domain-containing protein [Lachnospiraceae bacterium]